MGRILIVEDEKGIQFVFRQTLERLGGYRVTVTEDVTEILSLAATRQVDLVVMDVALTNSSYQGQDLDGIQLTRLIKEQAGSHRLPVLLVTAYAMPGDAERLLNASGAEGYLSKPIGSLFDLINKVKELLAAAAQGDGGTDA